jgi:RNA recognition motif-containing protein
MSTVTVSNISPVTSKQAISDFFSFCGKIKDIDITEGETKTATITFEHATAQKTALLLNNTLLGPNHISVTSDAPEDDSHQPSAEVHNETGEISQEDKPRARVLAEYIAHGYVIGDAAVTRALELDNKHGVSARFFNTLQRLDQKYHASEKARAADQSYGVSQKAGSWWSGLSSYFEQATNTPTGQKIVKFYTDGQRQVQDVYNEAKRLAELKKEAAGGSAVKAAGLERVLGKETSTESESGAKPGVDQSSGTMSSVPVESTPAVPATQH